MYVCIIRQVLDRMWQGTLTMAGADLNRTLLQEEFYTEFQSETSINRIAEVNATATVYVCTYVGTAVASAGVEQWCLLGGRLMTFVCSFSPIIVFVFMHTHIHSTFILYGMGTILFAWRYTQLESRIRADNFTYELVEINFASATILPLFRWNISLPLFARINLVRTVCFQIMSIISVQF